MERTQEERTLIKDLLELGHLEVINSFPKDDVYLDEVLQVILETYRAQIDEKKIDLQINISPAIPAITAAPDQIKSLWNNLISNAIKYTPEYGQIRVALNIGPQNDIIGEISDTGIGVPEEAKEKLFTEFFRAKNAKELEIPGTGLGLVIVKKILDGLNGNISVKSQADEGTTFRFMIPAKLTKLVDEE